MRAFNALVSRLIAGDVKLLNKSLAQHTSSLAISQNSSSSPEGSFPFQSSADDTSITGKINKYKIVATFVYVKTSFMFIYNK